MKQGTGCRARLATLADDSQVLLDSMEIEHNHEGNHDEVKHEVFLVRLKEIISNDPTLEPVQAVARAEVLYGKTYMKSFKSMVNFVSAIQRKLGVPSKAYNRNQKLAAPILTTKNTGVRYQGERAPCPESSGLAYDTMAQGGSQP